MSNPDISHNENDMYFLPSLEFFILIEETNSLPEAPDFHHGTSMDATFLTADTGDLENDSFAKDSFETRPSKAFRITFGAQPNN